MIYLQLFFEFLKIGLFTFGGGYAMIPLIRDVVIKHEWLTEDQFLNMIGISEVTPGPIAINMATYVGSTQGGLLGSILATIGVVLPAFIIMLIISILLRKVIKNKIIQAALSGIKFMAIALIISSALTMFFNTLAPISLNNIRPQYDEFRIFVLIIGSYFLIKIIIKKKPGPITVITLSALVGLVVGYI